MSNPDFDWDGDAILRKYHNTICTMRNLDTGETRLAYINELNPSNPEVDIPAKAHFITPFGSIDPDKYPKGVNRQMSCTNPQTVGVVTANSKAPYLYQAGVYLQRVQLSGFSKPAGYFISFDLKAYFCSRKMQKSFKWGMEYDNFEIKVVTPALNNAKAIDWAKAQGVKASTDEYKLLSNDVLVDRGALYILGVHVGFEENGVVTIKSRAVAKIISELEPSWKINFW